MKRYDIQALPVSYLIDERGRVAAVYVGLIDSENVKANINALLAEDSTRRRRGRFRSGAKSPFINVAWPSDQVVLKVLSFAYFVSQLLHNSLASVKDLVYFLSTLG